LLAGWLGSLPLLARSAQAETRVHALVLANNQSFRASAEAAPGADSLRYADDDAAAFYDLLRPLAPAAELLTVLDRETQALYPDLAHIAQVPSIAGVRLAIARLRARIAAERQQGHRNVVFVFYSGHGVLDAGGKPALALFDGGMSQEFLYRELLAQLPADELHLLVDACHAEAVVRPRDADAQIVEVRPDQAQAFLLHETLAGFPHAGAIVAATSDAKAHEWDTLGHGVFTYELLSALRGAADVNRDRRIEYSEVYAFMLAANREVADARARLQVVARPPAANRRTALVDLSTFPRAGLGWLSDIPGVYGLIEVSDGRGRRLASVHGDQSALADLLLPTTSPLYVRTAAGEAHVDLNAGHRLRFEQLTFRAARSRERGALADALRRGLFLTPYGRSYYQGVVDQQPGLIPIDFSTVDTPHYWRTLPAGSRLALVAGGGLATGIADVLPVMHGLSVGLRPQRGSGLALSLELLSAWDGPLAERHLFARAGWLWSAAYGPVHGFAGAMAGPGWLAQELEGAPSRHSAALSAGPVLGLSAQLSESLAMWSELQLSGLVHRRENATTLSLAPCAWLGGSLRL
jgi:hypothetical protein